MVQCWAPDCKHYNVRETCRFFSFPKDSKTRNRWIKLTRRTIPPGPGAFLCSCHFVDGNKNNGPTLFSHNIGKQFNFSSPEKRTRKRKVLDMEETSENSTYETELTDAQPSTSKETIPPGPMSAEIVAENYFLKQDLKRSRRNSAKKINLLKASVKMTVQEKHEAIVNCSDSTSISGTKHDVNRGTGTLPKKKLRNASKIDFNPDDFDPLDLNNLLLSTTNIFQGMCDELKNSMILKNPGNLNLDNEHITLTTSAGDKEQSVQIVIVNNKPEITNPSFESNKDNLEEMLDDIEKTIASAEKDYQENLSTRTISTQTDNRSLEAENKKLKLEIATLKSRIISLQNQLQQQDVPQLLFVCNDD